MEAKLIDAVFVYKVRLTELLRRHLKEVETRKGFGVRLCQDVARLQVGNRLKCKGCRPIQR